MKRYDEGGFQSMSGIRNNIFLDSFFSVNLHRIKETGEGNGAVPFFIYRA